MLSNFHIFQYHGIECRRSHMVDSRFLPLMVWFLTALPLIWVTTKMSKKFYQSPFYHLRTLSNTILPPTKMSNIMSKNAQKVIKSHQKPSSRFAVRTFPLSPRPKQKFAVRSSHPLSFHCPYTKVRGSQFAPSLSPLP